ncbi:expressed unknown protein [Seminavis robusta]|uniref:DDE Tnp4 domain-containing protein n=1 Tax=Seminavis robusta TaxID=568900 RepID=A0A9N8DT49_9STRA|nr:expressed unknown protein [Seminavis robusta]|eukprot:Sro262_g102081.1  (270) ;mRNA; r:71841-72650
MLDSFKAHFGKNPLHLARVYRDLQVFGILERAEAEKKNSFIGFMLANNFLRLYESADVRNARFNICHDNICDFTWRFVRMIGQLKQHKIKCPSEWKVRMGASVDGTQMRTNEPRDPDMRRNPKNYAYKFNFAGLNYQIVLSLWTNNVWYANLGDTGSTHDMTSIRKEFIDMVPEGCRVIADAGYSGKSEREKRIFAVVSEMDSPEVRAFKGAAKARQEVFNKKMKDFDCLTKRWIHGVDNHKLAFNACLVLTQYAIEDTSPHGEPLHTL